MQNTFIFCLHLDLLCVTSWAEWKPQTEYLSNLIFNYLLTLCKANGKTKVNFITLAISYLLFPCTFQFPRLPMHCPPLSLRLLVYNELPSLARKLLPCLQRRRRRRLLHAFLHFVGRQSVWIIKYAHSHTLTDSAKQRRFTAGARRGERREICPVGSSLTYLRLHFVFMLNYFWF